MGMYTGGALGSCPQYDRHEHYAGSCGHCANIALQAGGWGPEHAQWTPVRYAPCMHAGAATGSGKSPTSRRGGRVPAG
eukprot:10251600-Karenia_brevis.AAC.1